MIEDCADKLETLTDLLSVTPDDVYLLKERAYCYTQLGQPGLAVEDMNHAIKLAPYDSEVYAYRANAFSMYNETELAISDYKKAIELKPNEGHYYFILGKLYQIQLNQMELGEQYIKKGLELEPQLSNAFQEVADYYDANPLSIFSDDNADYLTQAIKCFNDGNLEQALEFCKIAAANNMDNPLVYYTTGSIYAQTDRPSEAIEFFNKAIELKPDYAEAFASRGGEYSKLSDFNKASEDLMHAINLDQRNGSYYFLVGLFLEFDLKKIDESNSWYNAAFNLNPEMMQDFEQIHHQYAIKKATVKLYPGLIERAQSCIMEANLEMSSIYCNQAIELRPYGSEAYATRAVINRELGDIESALKDFNKAISLNENFVEAYFHRGNLYSLKMGRADLAVKDYSKVIELEPNNYSAYSYRAMMYYTYLNEADLALKDYDTCIEIDPNRIEAYIGISSIVGFADPEKALKNINKAIELQPDNPNALTVRATFLLENFDRYEDAFIDIDKAIALGCKSPDCYATRAKAYNKLGRYEESVADCDKAINNEEQLYAFDSNATFAKLCKASCLANLGNHNDALEIIKALIPNWSFFTSKLKGLGHKDVADTLSNKGINWNYDDYFSDCNLEFFVRFHELSLSLTNFKFYNETFINLAILIDKFNYDKNDLSQQFKDTLKSATTMYFTSLLKGFEEFYEINDREIFILAAKFEITTLIKYYIESEISSKDNILKEEHKLIQNLTDTIAEQAANLNKKIVQIQEREKAEREFKIRDEERNLIIQKQAHDIKNMLSAVNHPLSIVQKKLNNPYLKKALKANHLMSTAIDAISQSFGVNPADFYYDAQNNENGVRLSDLVWSAIDNSVSNIMVNSSYTKKFTDNFFTDELREAANLDYLTLEGQETVNVISEFSNFVCKHLFNLNVNVDESVDYKIGSTKSSEFNLFSLFNELILNAVKNVSYVDSQQRRIDINLKQINDKLVFSVVNSFKTNTDAKSAGTGNLIIENFTKLIDCKVNWTIDKENGLYKAELLIHNFWENLNG